MTRAVIFDFDGVIIESEPYITEAELRVFTRHGIPLTHEVVVEYFGIRFDEYITTLEQRFNATVDHAQLSSDFEAEVAQMYENEIPLVPHIDEVLRAINFSFPIALATSRDRHLAQAAMRRLGIADYFKHGVYKEDVEKGKPNPEVYLKAAALIDVPPTECIAVEDAKLGFQAARAAGMYVIGRKADHNAEQDFSLADVVVEDMADILNFLH